MGFVGSGAEEDGPKDEEGEGDGAGVDEKPDDGDTFNFCVGELDREVIEREHAVKWFGEEDHQYISSQKYSYSHIVGGIRALPESRHCA